MAQNAYNIITITQSKKKDAEIRGRHGPCHSHLPGVISTSKAKFPLSGAIASNAIILQVLLAESQLNHTRDDEWPQVGRGPTIPIHRDDCFQDSLLMQPDDFHINSSTPT